MVVGSTNDLNPASLILSGASFTDGGKGGSGRGVYGQSTPLDSASSGALVQRFTGLRCPPGGDGDPGASVCIIPRPSKRPPECAMPVKKTVCQGNQGQEDCFCQAPPGGQGCRQAVFEAEDAGPGH